MRFVFVFCASSGMRKKPWRRSAPSRCPSMLRPSEKVTRTFGPDGTAAASPGASMNKIALSSEWATISAAPPPCGSGANSGFPEADHLGAATSGDRSSPALGGGADHAASSGTALEGAMRTGLVGGGGGDQSATGSGAAGADQISSALGGAGCGVVGHSWGVAWGAAAQGEPLFTGGAIDQVGARGG